MYANKKTADRTLRSTETASVGSDRMSFLKRLWWVAEVVVSGGVEGG